MGHREPLGGSVSQQSTQRVYPGNQRTATQTVNAENRSTFTHLRSGILLGVWELVLRLNTSVGNYEKGAVGDQTAFLEIKKVHNGPNEEKLTRGNE